MQLISIEIPIQVQLVSSSEPDSVVSPVDGAQSPSSDNERSTSKYRY